MRLPFAFAAATAAVGLTGFIVAGSRGPAAPAGGHQTATAGPTSAPPERLIDTARLARGLEQMPRAHPTRNPFEFGAERRASGSAARPTTAPPPQAWNEAAPPQRPTVQLIGIAEDAGPDGSAVRTAVVGAMNQVYLVKEGEQIALRFLVREITGEGVEIEDLTDETIIRLPLR